MSWHFSSIYISILIVNRSLFEMRKLLRGKLLCEWFLLARQTKKWVDIRNKYLIEYSITSVRKKQLYFAWIKKNSKKGEKVAQLNLWQSKEDKNREFFFPFSLFFHVKYKTVTYCCTTKNYDVHVLCSFFKSYSGSFAIWEMCNSSIEKNDDAADNMGVNARWNLQFTCSLS